MSRPTRYSVHGRTMRELLESLRWQVYLAATGEVSLDKAAESLGLHPATLRRYKRTRKNVRTSQDSQTT